jgi:mycothiol synthase
MDKIERGSNSISQAQKASHPMRHITSRAYEGAKDFQAMLDFTAQVRPPEHRNDYPGQVDLEEAFASVIAPKNTRLWFANNSLIAWAHVDGCNNLLWELEQEYAGQLGKKIVKWAEQCVRRNLSNVGVGALYANCRESYTDRMSFLKQHGFNQLENTTVALMRSLSEPIRLPELPPGFLLRPILGKHEAADVAAMHRAAFGTGYMTTENRLIIMNTSAYDPSLDLVVIAPDGSIAANCICSVNLQEKIGFTDPVAAHPRFQGIGLVRALLLTGLKLLKERGMTRARLGTSGDNIRMQRSAESVGFTIEYKTIWFKKDVT